MWKKIILAVIALAVIIVVAGLTVEYVYADQILPGVKIDGVSYAKQNQSQVLTTLNQKYADLAKQGITFVLDDKKLSANYADLGLSVDAEKMVSTAMQLSHTQISGVGPFKVLWAIITQKNNIQLAYSFNESVRAKYFDEKIDKTFDISPTDASLNFTTDPVSVNANKDGLWVDNVTLTANLISAVKTYQSTILVPLKIKTADIKAEQLSTATKDAEQILDHNITLSANSKTFSPTKEDVSKWISLQTTDGVLRAVIDSEKVKTYLNDVVAAKVNTKSKNSVVDQNNNVISSGTDGVTLVIDDSISAIQTAYSSTNLKQTVKLAVKIQQSSQTTVNTQDGSTPGLYEGKYIEINLTKQRMYLYEGTNFINSFRISSGKASMPTPTGTFQIYNTIRTAYSKEYDLYMPFWHAFSADGAYGIHGLPYRGSWVEGASHIGTPVSHGCVRLGSGNDEYVYNWATIGTPVVIHK